MIRKIFQWLLRNQKKEIEYKTEEKVKTEQVEKEEQIFPKKVQEESAPKL